MGLSRDVKRTVLSGTLGPLEGVKVDQIFENLDMSQLRTLADILGIT